jgi:replicative DNA helicase
MSRDDTDKAILGELPEDPREDCTKVQDCPRIVTAREMLEGSVRRAEHGRDRGFSPTGNSILDDMTGGIVPGLSWVFAARTNYGKTMWTVAVTDENLRAGRGVLIVSIEDPEELYADRLMLRRCCVRARNRRGVPVSADNLRLGNLTDDEKMAMREVANEGERKPMFLNASDWTGERIERELDRILPAYPEIELVILDYIQEVQSDERHNTMREKVSSNAKRLRNVAARHDRGLIIVSQITDDEDPDKWPRMKQVRDAKDVVIGAAYVLMGGVATTEVRDGSGNIIMVAGERGVRVEKVKRGRKGMVKLPWDDDAACFLPVTIGQPTDPKPPLRSGSWSPNAAPRDPREPAERDYGDGIDDGFCGLPAV